MGRAGRTVDVDDAPAVAADQVVVVVADPCLVPRRRSGRFEPSDQTGRDQGTEHVVHSLRGDLAEVPAAYGSCDRFDVQVGCLEDRGQDSDPGSGHSEAGLPQQGGKFLPAARMAFQDVRHRASRHGLLE